MSMPADPSPQGGVLVNYLVRPDGEWIRVAELLLLLTTLATELSEEGAPEETVTLSLALRDELERQSVLARSVG